jgi:isopentenyldiphosphate isomerase
MSEEIFDIVNERDEVIGRLPRSQVHREGRKHRAVHVLVFNARGEIFLQKRSMAKDTFPARGIRRPPATWTAARITTPAPCGNCARNWGW